MPNTLSLFPREKLHDMIEQFSFPRVFNYLISEANFFQSCSETPQLKELWKRRAENLEALRTVMIDLEIYYRETN